MAKMVLICKHRIDNTYADADAEAEAEANTDADADADADTDTDTLIAAHTDTDRDRDTFTDTDTDTDTQICVFLCVYAEEKGRKEERARGCVCVQKENGDTGRQRCRKCRICIGHFRKRDI